MVIETFEYLNRDMLNVLILQYTQRRLDMAYVAVKAFFLYGIFYPLYAYTMVITFGDIRFWVLTLILIVTSVWRFTRWLRRDDRKNEALVWDNRMKELAVHEKEIELRERDLIIMERENNIIKQIKL